VHRLKFVGQRTDSGDDVNTKGPLGDDSKDRAIRIVTNLSGAIPVVGPVLQTVLAEVLPDLRLKRIETYLLALQAQVDEGRLRDALNSPEGLDTFEEGLWQSARALTEERKKHIATLVAKGLSDSAKSSQARHFLRLLTMLDDTQIIILCSHQSAFTNTSKEEVSDFFKRHRNVLGPFNREIGSHNPDQGKWAHKAALEEHLASLGLLQVASEDWETNLRTFLLSPQGRYFLIFLDLYR
jgi:hypothetical protein